MSYTDTDISKSAPKSVNIGRINLPGSFGSGYLFSITKGNGGEGNAAENGGK